MMAEDQKAKKGPPSHKLLFLLLSIIVILLVIGVFFFFLITTNVFSSNTANNETILEMDGLRKEPILHRPITDRISDTSEELPEYTPRQAETTEMIPTTVIDGIENEALISIETSKEHELIPSIDSQDPIITITPHLGESTRKPEIPMNEEQEQIDGCSAIEEIQTSSCPMPTGNPDNREILETYSEGHLSGFRPSYYNLSFLLRSISGLELSGSLHLQLKAIQKTNMIILHMSDGMRLLNERSLRIISCTNEKSICIRNIHHDQRRGLLLIELDDQIEKDDRIRLSINEFYSRNAASLFSQRSGFTKAPEMMGTHLLIGGPRKIFPCIDHPSFKTAFSLCISHPPLFNIRSNMAPKDHTNQGENMDHQIRHYRKSCFQPTLPLSTHQIAFIASQNAQSKVYNSSDFEDQSVPVIEILFSQGEKLISKVSESRWLPEETAKMMKTMKEWTGVAYPLERLSLASAPIPGPHPLSSGGLGLIILPATAIEHEKHRLSHSLLIRALISQWIGGIIGSKNNEDICIQESLSAYLEGKVHEDLKITPIINRTRTKALAEIEKNKALEFRSTRPLTPEQTVHLCGERKMALFYSLDETFGPTTVIGMLKQIFVHHSFGQAGVEDYAKALETQTRSKAAGELLKKWFRSTQSPVILLKVQNNEILVQQPNDHPWEMPLEIGNSAGLRLIDIQGNGSIPFQSMDYVIADPKRRSVAFIGYDLETYLRLMRCWDDSHCPTSKENLKQLFKDFGTLLLAKYIQDSSRTNGPRWREFFGFLNRNSLLEGNALCCIAYAIDPKLQPNGGKCFFAVQDICSKVDLIEKIAFP